MTVLIRCSVPIVAVIPLVAALTLSPLSTPPAQAQTLPAPPAPTDSTALPTFRWQPYPMPRTSAVCSVTSAAASGKALVRFEPFGGGVYSVLSPAGEQRLHSTSTAGVAYDDIWPERIAEDGTVHGTVNSRSRPRERNLPARWLPDGTLTTAQLPHDDVSDYRGWALAAVTPTGDAIWARSDVRPPADTRPDRLIWKRDGTVLPLDMPQEVLVGTLAFSETGEAAAISHSGNVLRRDAKGTWAALMAAGKTVEGSSVGMSSDGSHIVSAHFRTGGKQVVITHHDVNGHEPVVATLPVKYVDTVRLHVTDNGTALVDTSASDIMLARGSDLVPVMSRVVNRPSTLSYLSIDAKATNAGTVVTYTRNETRRFCEYGALVPITPTTAMTGSVR